MWILCFMPSPRRSISSKSVTSSTIGGSRRRRRSSQTEHMRHHTIVQIELRLKDNQVTNL